MALSPLSAQHDQPTFVAECVLTALYLPSARRPHDPPKAAWQAVCGRLRQSACLLGGAAQALRAAGLWSEALALESPGLLAWGEGLVLAESTLTAASPLYPRRWLALSNPPPALHRAGSMPSRSLVSVVGSRHVDGKVRRFASQVGLEAARLEFAVVSGGAIGSDRAAVSQCPGFIEILPHGLFPGPEDGGCRLSARQPGEPFTVAGAMERNALIYGASEHTVVVHARFKQGGTWTGATDAARRRLTRLLVREVPNDPAHRALISLGGIPLREPEDLESALSAPPAQCRLFEAER